MRYIYNPFEPCGVISNLLENISDLKYLKVRIKKAMVWKVSNFMKLVRPLSPRILFWRAQSYMIPPNGNSTFDPMLHATHINLTKYSIPCPNTRAK